MNNIEQLLTELYAKDVKVWAENGQLRVSAPKGVLTPALRSELAARKAELLAALGQINGHAPPSRDTLRPAARSRQLPLSFNQQRLWVMEQINPSSAYNQLGALCFEGELNIPALAQSLTEIVRRHEILRTVFPEQHGGPVQVIQPPHPIQLPVLDLTELDDPARAARVQQLAIAEAQQPFDLAVAPLLRLKLLRLAPQSHILFLMTHHICGDGWSGGVLSRELAALYTAYVHGAASPLPEPPLQYADYAVWQRQWMDDAASAAQLAYWKQQLAGLPPLLELPADHARPAVQRFCGALHRFEFSPALGEKLRTLSSRSQTTPFMIGLTAFAILLARYSRTDDIAIGSLIANRSRRELEELIGFFANTLVLRIDLAGEPTVLELLARVRKMTLAAYDHQELPFEKLVDELRPERSLSYNPLFQVLFTWQSNSTLAPVALPAVTVKALDIHPGAAKFDLHLNLWDADTGGLRGELEYNSDLFDAATITRMAGHLQVLLAAMVENPEERVTRLPLLTEAERRQLLVEWNDTATPYPQDKRLHQWVEEQVMRTPNAVAVTFEGQQLTYRELNERANQLAHHLQRLGVGGPLGAETLVGICVERSLEMVVGLLGILKAGGAYVPLDPTYPAERLAFMLEDASPAVLLTQHHLLPHLSNCESEVLCLDTGWTAIAQASTQNANVALDKDNLAYMIYTSGSTGRPKGAMNTHGAICNRLLWMQDEYGLTPADSVLQKTPFSFDVSVWEFFWPLMTGARLVVARPEGHKDSAYLVRIIVEEQITTLHFVPSMLQIFVNEPGLEACRSLKRIICSGEALPFALQQRLFERLDVELHNLYGPTEAAVDVTYWACERESERMLVPIGRPVANTQIYLLDPYLQPTPIGVPGELYIGGVQLARGYLNRPELTAEKFVPDPFSSEPGARLYRTGDLARYLPDGAIEYLGRIDFQVKIRGFRIELGEVESVLANHPAVHEIVVVARADQMGTQQLVAYIVLTQDHRPTTGELRDFAQQRLPEYMVPAAFVVLDALPLSSNGKVDRRALPAPDHGRLALSSGFVAADTPQEQLLADIWAGLLGLEQVGVHDNFFELGGDSLLATQVIARAREGGLSLTLQQLFQHQTIFELARVAGQQAAVAPPLRLEAFDLIGAADRQKLPADVEDAYPMTALQAGMVFHSEKTPGSAVYHDVFSYHLRAPFDLAALRTAIQQLAADHEVLRTSFALTGFSQPLQLVHPSAAIPVPAEDLRHLPPDAQVAAIEAWVDAESRRPFRWDCPPFVRFCVQRRSDDTFNLSVGFHHAILDGWSLASLLTELYQRYFVLLGHEALTLDPPLALKFRDYVALERESAASPAQQAFWVQQLAGCQRSRLPRWPAAYRSPQPRRGQSLPIPVPANLSDRLHKLAQEAGVPLKSVLLAAHLRVLRTLYNEADVLTGLAAQGRPEAIDSERVKGLFLNTLPFRLQLHGGTWLDLIRATFRAEQEVLPYQRYPLVEVQRALGGQPLLETLFFTVHFHVFERLQELPGFAVLGETFAQQTNFALVTGFMQDPLSSQLTLLGLDYDSSQLCEAQVRAIGAYYLQTLAAMVADPAGRYESHSLLPAAERQQLLVEWNNTHTAYPHGQTIHHLFEEQAANTPDAVAVVFGEERLTYRELNARANQLAHHLMAHDVGGALGAETVVGLCVDRSAEMIIGLLGILKAGGAYLPLDPT
ncbi:MAG: amino acid adenylation domain-containing protein, partial [Caldilineaceae bacterium]|nr:amino acid adenylation domain-containing protein [Caldilineaceae bacterium]